MQYGASKMTEVMTQCDVTSRHDQRNLCYLVEQTEGNVWNAKNLNNVL